MIVTSENYYTAEADTEYLSVSQYKDFCGTYGIRGCEYQALERLEGRYPEKKGIALIVGGYVDAYFEGTIDNYRKAHPEIFKKDGGLKADFAQAEEIIKRVEADPMFMYYMSGQKQVIVTGEIAGVKWKGKIDSLLDDAIVDLKVVAKIQDKKWVQDIGEYLDFIRYWGYDIQGAVYQELVYQQYGVKLPFVIAAVSKEEEPDLELIEVDQVYLDEAMRLVKFNVPRIARLKAHIDVPEQCGICNCCKRNKVLVGPIKLSKMANQK